MALAGLTLPASAQQDSKPKDTTLREVVVTATRSETEAQKVPATITRIGRESVDARLPADETELFGGEPDVAFGRDARRFGATRPNIRGIEDNRVLQLVDGIQLPAFYNGGGPTNFTMNAPLGPSLGFLKRVEILRGPASSLYGSDAIGGVVGFLTLDPDDLLERDARLGARAQLGYNGTNDGATATALGAGRGESLQWVLGYTQTRAREFDNKGDHASVDPMRTRPNRLRLEEQGGFAKFIVQPAAGHRVSLTLEARKQDADVEVLRLTSSLRKVSAMGGNDNTQR
ncbi:MAG: TonB-dependent receptor plug domain-containing protein, partial [Burkholderiales bacterium]|nr:TonB-dependent receptor plug domain-containing protein [Burkholderiales bacterium]